MIENHSFIKQQIITLNYTEEFFLDEWKNNKNKNKLETLRKRTKHMRETNLQKEIIRETLFYSKINSIYMS